MEQLLLHLFGDFIVQNDYVALNKKNNTLKGWIYCFFHCITYALPFLLITNWKAVIGIGLTHFIIDKTNIVAYFLAIRNNVVKEGENLCDGWHTLDVSNFGFLPERPFAITIWLLIFTDNTLHLICNYLFILYF
jgi:hypothetical protein